MDYFRYRASCVLIKSGNALTNKYGLNRCYHGFEAHITQHDTLVRLFTPALCREHPSPNPSASRTILLVDCSRLGRLSYPAQLSVALQLAIWVVGRPDHNVHILTQELLHPKVEGGVGEEGAVAGSSAAIDEPARSQTGSALVPITNNHCCVYPDMPWWKAHQDPSTGKGCSRVRHVPNRPNGRMRLATLREAH